MEKKPLEILVVEDMPENLAAAKDYFQGIGGVKIDYASNFEQAKKKLEDNVYAAAIIDLHIPKAEGGMPEKIGYELAAMAQQYSVCFVIFSAASHGGKSFVNMQPGGTFGMMGSGSATKSPSKSVPEAWEEAFAELQKQFPGMGTIQAAKMKYKQVLGIQYKVQQRPDWSR